MRSTEVVCFVFVLLTFVGLNALECPQGTVNGDCSTSSQNNGEDVGILFGQPFESVFLNQPLVDGRFVDGYINL